MNTVVISSVSTFETLLPPPPSHNARIFFCFVNISEKGRAQLHYLVMIFLCIASSPLWHFYVHDRGSVRSAAQQNPDTFIDYYQCYSCNLPIYFPSPILFYFRNQVVFFQLESNVCSLGNYFSRVPLVHKITYEYYRFTLFLICMMFRVVIIRLFIIFWQSCLKGRF